MRSSARVRAGLSVPAFTLMIALTTAGMSLACYVWKPVTEPTPDYLSSHSKDTYRIHARQSVVVLTEIHLRNDSLIGTPARGNRGVQTGVPTTEIVKVERRGVSTGRTIALVAGATAVAAVVAAAIALSSSGDWFTLGDSEDTWSYSCPLLYSWDGETWWLDSGTFSDAITPALARTDLDNLIHARAGSGVLRFLLTDEADETEHVDALSVLAIDHPAGTSVVPDGRVNGRLFAVDGVRAPVAARDDMGRESLNQLATMDGWFWESRLDGRDPANPAHIRDGIELTFQRPPSERALLIVDAQNTTWASYLMGEMIRASGRLTATWYDSATTVAASIPLDQMIRQAGTLSASVWDGASWRPVGSLWPAGPEVSKRQALPLDLTRIPGDTLRIRLESTPALWDVDFVGLGVQVEAPITTHELTTTMASAPRDPDALAKLTSPDGRMLDMEYGDTVRLEMRDAPPPAKGTVRSYLARTTGWYRIHGRDTADPDLATLATLAQPHGAARLAVTRLNDMLAQLEREAADAKRR